LGDRIQQPCGKVRHQHRQVPPLCETDDLVARGNAGKGRELGSMATPTADLRDRSAHSLNQRPWIKRQTLADAAANDKARTVINPMSQSLP
jgi:hypothetical protein